MLISGTVQDYRSVSIGLLGVIYPHPFAAVYVVQIPLPMKNGNIWDYDGMATPHQIQIPKPITVKLCTVDYVLKTNL